MEFSFTTKSLMIFTASVLVSVTPLAVAAQQPSTGQAEPARTAERAQEGEAPVKQPSAERRIGVGDVLDIRTINEPKYSREGVRVDARGLIIIPRVEAEVKAACKTEAELAREITGYYREYLRRPQVDVFIKEYQAQPAAVIGAVTQPGRFQMQRPVRLLELLSFAGGPTEHAGRFVQIVHSAPQTGCDAQPPTGEEDASNSGFDSYVLNDILKGDAKSNPLVQPGDIITIPEAEQVYVVGNVFKPSAIPMKEPLTVSRAIAMAGGTMRDTKSNRVRIVRSTPGSPAKTEIYIDLAAIEKRKAEDVLLQPNDIVDVPTSGTKSVLRSLLGSIAPTVSQVPILIR
jgi:polysaccharide export outer membrane protein